MFETNFYLFSFYILFLIIEYFFDIIVIYALSNKLNAFNCVREYNYQEIVDNLSKGSIKDSKQEQKK